MNGRTQGWTVEYFQNPKEIQVDPKITLLRGDRLELQGWVGFQPGKESREETGSGGENELS